MSTPERQPGLQRVDILDVPFRAGTLQDVVEELSSAVDGGEPFYATFTGVHGVMEAQREPDVLAAHRGARVVACDGMPMVWASRWVGVPEAERAYGPDFMLAFCERAAAEGWSSFFYGGRVGVAERLATQLQDRFPGFPVAGTHSPPFHTPSQREEAETISMIDASGADLVWVGLSTPVQELWMSEHVGRLRARALFGVGAAFDFLSGAVRQSPKWLQNIGLEWMFRMAIEPRRLAPRYMRNNPDFVRAIVRQRPRLIECPVISPGN